MTTIGALTVEARGDREIVMTRTFDAPRHLVFAALTKPDLLRRWLGVFGDWSMEICEVDLKVGGSYRYVWHGPNGAEMGMRGVYREIAPNERIVSTEVFDEPWYPGEAVGTATLAEQDGRTTLTTAVRYASREARDGVLASGIARGVAAGYDALDALLVPIDAEPGLTDTMSSTTDFIPAEVRAQDSIADRYRRRADAFERKVAAVHPDQWDNPSPCAAWTARDVVGHIVDMHGVMLRPLDRTLTPAPSLADDPLGAFRAARADVEALLNDPGLAATEVDAPAGRMTVEQHVDQVPSADMVPHGWDLARATGQDDRIDTAEAEALWSAMSAIPPELMEQFRTPGAFGPGVEVFGPEVPVPADAPLQDRLLGLIGRDPAWAPPVGTRAYRRPGPAPSERYHRTTDRRGEGTLP